MLMFPDVYPTKRFSQLCWVANIGFECPMCGTNSRFLHIENEIKRQITIQFLQRFKRVLNVVLDWRHERYFMLV